MEAIGAVPVARIGVVSNINELPINDVPFLNRIICLLVLNKIMKL
jgi:hypothetical protein